MDDQTSSPAPPPPPPPPRPTRFAAAVSYIHRGWAPIPIPHREKNPGRQGWPDERYTADTARSAFAGAGNLGVICGEASGGLVCVDLDVPEAVTLAPAILPRTGLVHGRAGSPTSHYWYVSPGIDKSVRHDDPAPAPNEKGRIVEILSTGAQCVVSPSTHPSGELVEWERDGEPAQVDAGALRAAAARLAAASLLARHWPAVGSRDEASMALAGGLLRAGWDPAEADRFAVAVATAAGDEEAGTRAKATATAAKLAAGEAVTGWHHLGELLAGDGAKVVAKIRGWLGATVGAGDDDESCTDDGGGDARPSAATALVAIVSGACELFHDARGVPYARMHDTGEILRLRSARLRSWLAGIYYERTRSAAGGEARASALAILEAMAAAGPIASVHVRIAPGPAGEVLLDLADATHRVVEISAGGWRVLDRPPVRFWRPEGVLPLPVPERGGRLSDLRAHVNVADDGEWSLLAASLVMAMMPAGPYPVLCLYGRQGSAKTTAGEMVRGLVDPHELPLRGEPRELRDLAIASARNWVAGFDNVSKIQPWLSDGLCRLATGGGFATRALYTDEEETIFSATRPTIITAIDEVIVRGDLLDRAVVVTLPAIPEERRRPAREVWRAFDAARPRILGGLLDAASRALRDRESVRLPVLPRMADYAEVAVAAEPAIGVPSGTFLAAYAANRRAGAQTVIDSEPVVQAVIDHMAARSSWEGTATDLLRELRGIVDDDARRDKWWPRSGRGVTSALLRAEPYLEDAGISMSRGRVGHDRARTVCLRRVGARPSAPSASSAGGEVPADVGVPAGPPADGCGRNADGTASEPSAGWPAETGAGPAVLGQADGADGADGSAPASSPPSDEILGAAEPEDGGDTDFPYGANVAPEPPPAPAGGAPPEIATAPTLREIVEHEEAAVSAAMLSDPRACPDCGVGLATDDPNNIEAHRGSARCLERQGPARRAAHHDEIMEDAVRARPGERITWYIDSTGAKPLAQERREAVRRLVAAGRLRFEKGPRGSKLVFAVGIRAEGTPPPASDACPDEVVGAETLAPIVSYMRDRLGLRTAGQVVEACARWRSASPVLRRTRVDEERAARLLERLAPYEVAP